MLGLLADFSGILAGCIVGDIFFSKKELSETFTVICGIIISMTGIVGFITSVICIENNELNSPNLITVVICLIIGTFAGEITDLESKIHNVKLIRHSDKHFDSANSLVTGTVMFAIGGMAIIGPVEAFTVGDNTTLYLKALIDFTIALSFGGAMGKISGLSAFPVLIIELIIGVISLFLSDFFVGEVIDLLCGVGYVVFFFSGFNFIFKKITQIKTVNMLPSVLTAFLYELFVYLIHTVR